MMLLSCALILSIAYNVRCALDLHKERKRRLELEQILAVRRQLLREIEPTASDQEGE